MESVSIPPEPSPAPQQLPLIKSHRWVPVLLALGIIVILGLGGIIIGKYNFFSSPSLPIVSTTPTPAEQDSGALKDALGKYEAASGRKNPVSSSCDTGVKRPNEKGLVEYKNQKYLYSLQYSAKQFQVQEFNDCAIVVFTPAVTYPTGSTASVYDYYFEITVVDTAENLDPKTWLKSSLAGIYGLPDIAAKIQEREFYLRGLRAVEVAPIPGQVDSSVVAIAAPNRIIEIEMYPAPAYPGGTELPNPSNWHDSQKVFPATFYSILDSFRLVESPGEWKEYSSEKHGFTLQYPDSWEVRGPIQEDSPSEIAYFMSPVGIYSQVERRPMVLAIFVEELPKLNFKSENIGNYSTLKTTEWPGGGLSYFFRLPSGVGYIALDVGPYNVQEPYPDQEKYEAVFKKILSTFRFID